MDHALKKGVFITVDPIISVADVPLIGLNLKLALASIETMLDYGLMRDWDEPYRCCDGIPEAGGEPETGLSAGEEAMDYNLGEPL